MGLTLNGKGADSFPPDSFRLGRDEYGCFLSPSRACVYKSERPAAERPFKDIVERFINLKEQLAADIHGFLKKEKERASGLPSGKTGRPSFWLFSRRSYALR